MKVEAWDLEYPQIPFSPKGNVVKSICSSYNTGGLCNIESDRDRIRDATPSEREGERYFGICK